jgi:predicted nucleotidyltransferase
MKTAAVIAEFNPPHSGHAYLVQSIRRMLGDDTAVIAIMSGNYVQRGDLAICDGYTRARMALSLGVNLVLELPFPYSLATAQEYARAAVSIADGLGCIDYLCFGSESGDLEQLTRIASTYDSASFNEKLSSQRSGKQFEACGYAEVRSHLLEQYLSHEDVQASRKPNNILAVAYLQALQNTTHPIAPLTCVRQGGYHDLAAKDGTYASASCIRKYIFEQKFSEVQKYLTCDAMSILEQSTGDGGCPASLDRLSAAILTHLRTKKAGDFASIADCDASLGERIRSALNEATNFDELIKRSKAKHYTDAHIRRALLFAYFGVTSSELAEAPAYTKLLASDTLGCGLLKIIKQTGSLPVLTKPADERARLRGAALRQAEIAAFADSVYFQSLPKPRSAAEVFRKTPFVGK